MTKSKKLSTVIALCAASAVCVAAGGVLLNHAVAYAEDYTIVDETGDRIAYGAGWGADASAKVVAAFEGKGFEKGDIQLYRKDYMDGDKFDAGRVVAFAAEKDTDEDGTIDSVFLYNVLNEAIYEVKGNFVVNNLDQQIRNIGVPVAEETTNVKVTGYDGNGGNEVTVNSGTKVQLFETGLIVQNGENVEVHTGVIENVSATEYKIHPLINDQDVLATGKGNKITANDKELGFVGDIDGTWHALRTARTSRKDGKLVVDYNFRAGCIEVKYNDDWSLDSRMAYAGQNFNAAGTRVNLPAENYTEDEHLWTGVNSAALSMYQSLSGNPNATEQDLKDVFRAGYLNMVNDPEHPVIPGYRCSDIKTWSFIVVDYKYSPDSTKGFDGVGTAGRERMFTLVYSGIKNAVYGVGDDFFIAWKEDSIRPQLGAPMSNVMYDVTISGEHFDRIQIFETGYIYGKLNGSLIAETGKTTDPNYEHFIVKPAPAKPSEYGEQIGDPVEKTENGRTVYYYNYKRGAAKATEMATKTGYIYDYYPGRNFDDKLTLKLLDYDTLYPNGTFTLQFNNEGDNFTGWEDSYDDFYGTMPGVQSKMIAKAKELLNKGFFLGFPDGGFRTWNNVYGTQFIYGDSSATPFGGDARTNVCALMWNEDKEELFLVKDAYMDAWGGSTNAHQYLGAPVSDEFTLNSNPNVTFQYYTGTTYKNGKAFAVSTGYNAATWFTPNDEDSKTVTPANYLVSLSELSRPLTSVKLELLDYDLEVDGYAAFDWEIVGAWADATITFTSSNEEIAIVDNDGEVEFLSKGKVTITITVSDGVRTVKDTYSFNIKK